MLGFAVFTNTSNLSIPLKTVNRDKPFQMSWKNFNYLENVLYLPKNVLDIIDSMKNRFWFLKKPKQTNLTIFSHFKNGIEKSFM